ncbi:MAG: EamA family transporter [Patescibacteria group bacterium]|jgi:transporter family protein
MNWVALALISAALYGGYNFLIKVAAGSINQIVGALTLQIAAAVVGGVFLIIMKLTGQQFVVSPRGFFWAAIAGVVVGLAEITSFIVFSKGVSASIGVPIIIGGSVVAATILGLLFAKESLQWTQVLAICLIVAGAAILSAK